MASQNDLAASEQLEGWLAVPRHEIDEIDAQRPTGRAGAMLDARDALRSREDAATSGELDRILEDSLGQLTDGPRSLPSETADNARTLVSRRRSVRGQWIATAAALVLAVGVGALMLWSPEPEESAQYSADSATAVQPSQKEPAGAEADPAEVTTSVAGSPSKPADAPDLDTDSSPPADAGGPTASDNHEGSRGGSGDSMEAQGASQPTSTFAGVHATGRIRLP